jgi:hypothetical protein
MDIIVLGQKYTHFIIQEKVCLIVELLVCLGPLCSSFTQLIISIKSYKEPTQTTNSVGTLNLHLDVEVSG